MIPGLTELISDSGVWRSRWRQYDPEELLVVLEALPGELPQVRRALVLSHLGRDDEAAKTLDGLQGALAEGARVALRLNRIGASQDKTALRAIAELPEFVSGGGELALEGQLLLDQCRAQAWMTIGDLTEAGNLLRSALRIARSLGAPTEFIEAMIEGLARDPMERAKRLRGQLEMVMRANDLRSIGVVAADLADAALSCMDLDMVTRATRQIVNGRTRTAYNQAVAYLNGHRGLPVPDDDFPQPMFAAIRTLADLEQALLAKWSWDLVTANRIATQITAVTLPPGGFAGEDDLAKHLLSIVRARAWIIQGETAEARRELEMSSRYKRLMAVSQAVGLESALLGRTDDVEAWCQSLQDSLEFIPEEWCRWVITFCARVAPTATAYLGDRLEGEWRSVTLARIRVITGPLRTLGFKQNPTPADQARIEELKQYLERHPEQSLVINSFLAPKEQGTHES